ncbi:MAG: type III pantothenate kinase [Candidatus Omnitrophica bacterium]|nr:type III pantothenate kinase [Candidatus Omnitrophota bacterium]
MKKELLLVDIGNTSTTIAIAKNNKIVLFASVDTGLSAPLFKKTFLSAILKAKKKYKNLNQGIICSVVPKVSFLVVFILKKEICQMPLIVGKNLKVPIENCYQEPRQVGQDRLVCGYAARQLYGCPVIIIDLGTAITIDIVSCQGGYEGGVIVPGIRLTAQSLFHSTALLPNVKIAPPKSLIGRTTNESILSGIFHGYGALLDGLILRISKELKKKPRIILTGGHAKLMKKFVHKRVDAIDDKLVFKGMMLAFQSRL